MDLTGSILKETLPLSAELTSGSDGTGSSAIDTLISAPFTLLNMAALFIGGLFGDLGSSGSADLPAVIGEIAGGMLPQYL